MNKKHLIVTVLVITLFQYAYAEEKEHPIDKRLSECIDGNGTTYGMLDCQKEACKQWDAEMGKNYKLLMGILNEKEKHQLKDAQIAWLKYRDMETDFRMDVFLNQMPGTMYPLLALAEKSDIIKARALELKQLYDTLEITKK
jgi:uncharacterized protein YecT (DUF1311 family)